MKGYVITWSFFFTWFCFQVNAQVAIQWNLTVNNTVSSSDSRLSGQPVTLTNMALSSASTPTAFSTTYGMAVAPSADGKNWNASFDDTRYIQFAVRVTDGNMFQVNGVSFEIGSYGGNSISVAVYYSLNEDFSNAQALVPTSNPINQSIILDKNKLYSLSYSVSPSLSVLAGQTLYIRFYSMYNTTSSRWLLLRNFTILGTIGTAPPMIFPSVSILDGFIQSTSEPSEIQSYSLRARFLINDVTIIPPPGFEVSRDGSMWVGHSGSLVLPKNGGTLLNEPVQIYVRLRSSTPGVNAGNIQHTSTGASTAVVFVTGVKTALYYSNSNGNLTELSTWDLDPSGVGSNPPQSFTGDGQTFVIANRRIATITQNWTVSGSGSKIVVGNGVDSVHFIIPPTATVSGTVDVAAGSTITIQNSTVPTLGVLHKNSTVVFDGLDQVTIPAGTYGTLISTNDVGKVRTLVQGTYTIRKKFYPGNAAYSIVGSTFYFTDEAIDIPGFTYNNLVVSVSQARSVGTVRVVGQCTVNETFTVPVGSTLILQQGATIASGKNLIVNGTCINYDGLQPNVLIVNNGGVYEHAVNGGVIPTAQWNDGSTCKITGIIGSSGSDFTSLGGVNQTFSNFVIDCKSLLGKLLLTYNGGSFTVQRTFQVDATGSGIVQIARSSTQNTVNVGKYVQNGGIVYIIHAVSSTGTRALNVSGDFILDGNAIFGIINGRLSVAQAVTGVLAVGGAVEMRGSSRLVRDTARAHVIFNGTSKQRVALQNVSDSISIYVSNAQGVELTRNLSWTGTLVFTSGKLYLSKTMITLDSIIGASPTTYIQTDSIGVVRRFCKNSPVFYPVGSQTSYSPVTITNSGTPDWISVRASVDNSGSNNAADRVKLIWTIGEDTPGGTIATITLGWMSAAEGTNFALNRSTYSKIWNVTTRTEAGNGIYTLQTVTEPYSVTTYNVSTLSDFVVGKEWGSVSTSSGNPNLAVPHILTLSQNYPNPFNPVTIVEFTVPNISNVSLCVYDILGRMVMRVVEGVYNSGIVYRIPIDGSMLAAGTYFYRLEARPLHSNETAVLVRKLTLIK